jgi:hypothetical protein
MSQDKLEWKDYILRYLFDDPTIAAVHNIPPWSFDPNDKWIWLYSNSDTHIVKSAYKVATRVEGGSQGDTVLGEIWKMDIHVRLKLLNWRIALNFVPSKTSFLHKIHSKTLCLLLYFFTSIHSSTACKTFFLVRGCVEGNFEEGEAFESDFGYSELIDAHFVLGLLLVA